MKILVINGPNLNLLGLREPDVYGSTTLQDLEGSLVRAFPDVSFSFFQSNYEGGIIDRLHQAQAEEQDGIVLNPGAYTHTSVAIRDAVAAIRVPVIEVHLSNVHAREAFRHHSFVSAVCVGQVVGLGRRGYHLAVRYFLERNLIEE